MTGKSMLQPEDKEFISLLIQGSNAKQQFNYDLLSEKVDGVNQRLDKINGRINLHDQQISASIQERKIQDQKNNDEFARVDEKIVQTDKTHTLSCPYKDTANEFKFIQKYGKIIIAGLGVLVFVSFLSFAELWTKVNKNGIVGKENIKATEQVDSLLRK